MDGMRESVSGVIEAVIFHGKRTLFKG